MRTSRVSEEHHRAAVARVRRWLVLPAIGLALGATLATAAPTYASAIQPGFNKTVLPANDNGSIEVKLPFTIEFGGTNYSSVYVNNNGNVTFSGPLAQFTPSKLGMLGQPIIAPFWADVDTEVPGSAPVSYGVGTVDGYKAFGVNWPGVACHETPAGGSDDFQLLIVDRSDVAPGNFDIEFNYGSIQWDSGQASGGNEICQKGTSAIAGYTTGSGTTVKLAGSSEAGAFLDGGADALSTGSRNATTPGRYIFPIRAGATAPEDSVTGTVFNSSSEPVAAAVVSVCGGTPTACYQATTASNGSYAASGMTEGTYTATVSPPPGSAYGQTSSEPFAVTGSAFENVEVTEPLSPKPGTTIQGFDEAQIGEELLPVINWAKESPLTTTGCVGGSVTATITAENPYTGMVEATNPTTLVESPTGSGSFSGILPATRPLHGQATVALEVTGCMMPTEEEKTNFNIYIDPSGTVVDGANGDAPIVGATVTLLASESEAGPFAAVPNGSAIMSPANRVNPDMTREEGAFGWDAVAGYYKVQASKPGCGTATTPAFKIPPPVTELQVVLSCVRVLTSSLPAATRGEYYSAPPLEATGGKPPYKWSKTAPLPKGLTFNGRTGVISGTPYTTLAPGTYSIHVKATDSTPKVHQSATGVVSLQIL